MRVADLGCGPGFFTIHISRIVGPDGVVYAVDRSDAALRMLRASLQKRRDAARRIRMLRRDVSHTGIPTRSLDLAFFANVFHDIVERRAFIAELRRMLRPGGIAIDLDWKAVRTQAGPPLSIRLGSHDAAALLSRNGLDIKRIVSLGRHHYAIICTAPYAAPRG